VILIAINTFLPMSHRLVTMVHIHVHTHTHTHTHAHMHTVTHLAGATQTHTYTYKHHKHTGYVDPYTPASSRDAMSPMTTEHMAAWQGSASFDEVRPCNTLEIPL
jgi:hypothetical protein